jgi:hypothetical protein
MFDSPSFEEATRIDQLIYQLAAYEIANGYIMVPKDLDETYEYQNKIANKFNHFKRLIQNGEMTILELSSMVTKKNGPYYLKKTTVEEDIDAMTEVTEAKETNYIGNDSEYKNDGLIQQIFSNLIASNGNVKFVSFDQKTLDEFDAFNDKVKRENISIDKTQKKNGRNSSGKTNKTNTKNDSKKKKSK